MDAVKMDTKIYSISDDVEAYDGILIASESMRPHSAMKCTTCSTTGWIVEPVSLTHGWRETVS